MKRILITLLAFAMAVGPAFADNPAITAKLRNAVGILYSQGFNGEMKMHCTATAFNKTEKAYEFATAAHCVGNDNQSKERSATGRDIPFYITKDEQGTSKVYHRATIKWVGYQSRGEDFAVFTVQSPDGWDVIPLGDEKAEDAGSAITNIASPIGLGFQVFHGSVTSLYLDRPVVDSRGINWKGAMLLDIPANGGSSGSALVSQKSGSIVGFLVGSISNTIVGIPVSRFKSVQAAIVKGTYKWYVPDTELEPDGTVKQ